MAEAARLALTPGLRLLVQGHGDGPAWLRLARTISQIRPRDDKERAFLLERASTAAYIAYQRSSARNAEAGAAARSR